MTFSATDAAFEGFRVVRRKPVVLLWWALLYAALSLVSLALMSGMGDSFAEFVRVSEELEASSAGGAEPSPEEMGRMFGALGGYMASFAWIFPLQIIVGSVMAAGVARAVVRPSEGRFGYLRLGMDEVRVFVVSLVLGLIFGLVYIGCVIGIAVTGAIAGAIGEAWAGLIVLVAVLATLALLVWLAVRLSLAIPITVAERRMAFFDSFGVTRGRFWSMLGMAVITVVMVILVWLLSVMVMAPLTMMAGYNMLEVMMGGDPSAVFEMYSLSNPWMIAVAVAGAVMNALLMGVWYAPFAAAYRDLKGTGTPELA